MWPAPRRGWAADGTVPSSPAREPALPRPGGVPTIWRGTGVGLGGLGGPRAPSHSDSHLRSSFSPWSLSLGSLAFDIPPLHPLSLSLSHLSLGWVLVSSVSLLVSSGGSGSLHLFISLLSLCRSISITMFLLTPPLLFPFFCLSCSLLPPPASPRPMIQ